MFTEASPAVENILTYFAAFGLILGIWAARQNWKHRFDKTSKHQQFIDKAKREGNFTTAVACKSRVLLGIRDSNNPDLREHRRMATYKYIVNGKAYTISLAYENTGGVIPDYDATVTVYYNPENPDEAHIDNETALDVQRRGFLTSIAIFFGVTLGIIGVAKFVLIRLIG